MLLTPPAGFLSTTEVEIKKSRFITCLARTDTEMEARTLVAKVRARYPDARHHCVAFIVDTDGVRTSRSSDDGEPSGTAGIPMLNVLTHADVVNVTAVVTRYFGGIKLGTGGLTRAYSGCVAEAIESMPVVKRVEHDLWAVRIPHAQAGRIQEEIMRAGATVVSVVYHEEGVDLRLTTTDDPFSMIARITMGEVQPVRDGKILVEVPMRDSEV